MKKRYAALFTNQKGNVTKPLRLGLGACIIQAEYHYSDVETTLQIHETPYLQYFCGYKAKDDSKPPFDSSLMVYFRKRLTPEILGKINEMILGAQNVDENDGDDDDNSGSMIVDATCAPSQIKCPQDTALLNEARESTETLIDALHIPGAKKPRTYRKRAHKDYLALVSSCATSIEISKALKVCFYRTIFSRPARCFVWRPSARCMSSRKPCMMPIATRFPSALSA